MQRAAATLQVGREVRMLACEVCLSDLWSPEMLCFCHEPFAGSMTSFHADGSVRKSWHDTWRHIMKIRYSVRSAQSWVPQVCWDVELGLLY